MSEPNDPEPPESESADSTSDPKRRRADAYVDEQFEKHHRWVIRAVSKMIKGSIAEDIVQDVYLRARANGDKLLSHANPAAWLVRTAKNLTIEVLRHQQMRERNAPALRDMILIEAGDEIPMWQQIHPEKLLSLIEELSEEQQIIANMRLDGAKFKDIGKRLNCSTAAAHRRFKTMVSRLAELVREEIGH
ncbi:MAG: sigma-70 family RNA polymerase sigma factor [Deltaproteobacteria bacterium]